MARLDRPRDLRIFAAVADLGGFGRAGAALDISTSQASRAVKRLEDELGTRLLNRTTRQVALTDAGQALLERIGPLLDELDEAAEAVQAATGEPRGTLRVSLPVHFGLRFVAPVAAEYAAAHPHVGLELAFEDRRIDLVAEGFHLAVRIGPLLDSSLLARRLGTTRALTVASPAYLARRGTPEHPRELAAHDVLRYLQHDAGTTLRFGETTVRVAGRLASNHGQALREAAVRGLGIVSVPDFLVADELREGRLVRVLEEWESQLPITALHPHGRHVAPKVRVFVDLLVERLAEAPWFPPCP